MTYFPRRYRAVVGAALTGTALGAAEGSLATGFVVGLGLGITLSAFVRDEEE